MTGLTAATTVQPRKRVGRPCILPTMPMQEAEAICSAYWNIPRKDARKKIHLAVEYGWKASKVEDDIRHMETWMLAGYGPKEERGSRCITWGFLH